MSVVKMAGADGAGSAASPVNVRLRVVVNPHPI